MRRLPPHHVVGGTGGGRFRVPWRLEAPEDRGFGALLRWQWQRLTRGTPPNPPPGSFPPGEPNVAHPRTPAREIRVTWVGHSTFLVQAGGFNVLTDPIWSRRASPSQRFGPARLAPPGIAIEDLPALDAVVLSHDHYDHLDEGTVLALRERYGPDLLWITPLWYHEWLAARGMRKVEQLDWWEETKVRGEGGTGRIVCLPAQHWTRRSTSEMNTRLWASWAIVGRNGESVYFGGDSGFFAAYAEIGERAGPFDVVLLPIGAYEPRWFMRSSHMNPEDAVRAYRALGGQGTFVGMHWGTFRLTDEDPLEPPVRTRTAWEAQGLPPERLRILRHGDTAIVRSTSTAKKQRHR